MRLIEGKHLTLLEAEEFGTGDVLYIPLDVIGTVEPDDIRQELTLSHKYQQYVEINIRGTLAEFFDAVEFFPPKPIAWDNKDNDLPF